MRYVLAAVALLAATNMAVAADAPTAPAAPATRPASFLNIGPDWKNQLSLGALKTWGNDDTISLNGELSFHYTHKPDELQLKFGGVYGKSNDVQNAGVAYQTAVYRHDLADRLFCYVDDDVRYDAIKGISILATASTGLGYKIVDEPKLKIDLRGGPGVTYLRTFDDESNISLAAVAGLRIEYLLSDRATLTHEDTYSTSLEDFAAWRFRSETALDFKLDVERGLGLKVAFVDEYENQPSAGRSNNDARLTASLTLDF